MKTREFLKMPKKIREQVLWARKNFPRPLCGSNELRIGVSLYEVSFGCEFCSRKGGYAKTKTMAIMKWIDSVNNRVKHENK